MTPTQAERQLRESVDSLAVTIETHDGAPSELIDEIGVLEARAEISADGSLREITLVTGTGGPHIEVELHTAMVRGYWGTDTASATVSETIGLQQLRDRYGLLLDGVEVDSR